MADPIVLYSANTWLAVRIAENYYGGKHYVWCNRYFDSRSLPAHVGPVPPTSSPSDIYHSLYEEVRAGDRHSSKIEANKVGILKGASVKKQAGIITAGQEKDIHDIVQSAQSRDFKPLIFVIPFGPVSGMVQVVPVAQRAHPLWEEYVIEALPSAYFDVIELARNLP